MAMGKSKKRNRITGTRLASVNQTKKNELSPQSRKSGMCLSDAGNHLELWIAAAGELQAMRTFSQTFSLAWEFPGRNVVFNKTIAGRRRTLLLNENVVGSAMITKLNVVV